MKKSLGSLFRSYPGLSLWGVLVYLYFASILCAAPVRTWQTVEIELRAANVSPDPYAGPLVWVDLEGPGVSKRCHAFWDGGNMFRVRVMATVPGTWTWRSGAQLEGSGLSGQSGTFEAVAWTEAEKQVNPNRRGQVRIAAGGRHFEYADGTPVFLLADTLWAANTARCGLGANEGGPFFHYLADRQAKGFNTILMQYIHGYGDYPDGQAHRNEGGYAFLDRDPARLNPAYFQALDRRMQALGDRGFIAAIPTMWWGKTKKCVFTPEQACRISVYLAARYGTFNALWSLSGEYQYTFNDCGWTPADFSAMGTEVQRYNPWQHPLSIHPSGQINWKAPHNCQSSRPFHGETWLDHHWLQTGQSVDRLFNIVTRLAENRALEPAVPVFCSEAYYERVNDADTAYHTRWQVWTAFLNGAAGYGYGTQGTWQFLDPLDPQGEPGKQVSGAVPWHEAIRLPGSAQVRPARTLLESLAWWKLEPQRDGLRVDGGPNPLPTKADLTPPHAARIGDRMWVVYVPRGNEGRQIALAAGPARASLARWFDPRRGEFAGPAVAFPGGTLPARPAPAREDWVLIVESTQRIQPWSENPRYWQYKDKPVLLLGGSKDDNLFQIPDLQEHLDEMVAVGANYIRNTMSDRPDYGFEVRAFQQRPDGKFDFQQWNEEYWQRFENLLRWTAERDIIVQIELWDMHDMLRPDYWAAHPWNPDRNVNYTFENTRLPRQPSPTAYRSGESVGRPHEFFHSVPAVNNDVVLLGLQRRFVDRVLEHTLRYDHVLYCISNEIHTEYSPEWGWYWACHLRQRAMEAGRGIEVTEMYWAPKLNHRVHRDSLDRPEIYSFFEASQNSAVLDPEENWQNLQFVYQYLGARPRPINNTKVYGADTGGVWTGTTQNAQEKFWRNIFGGSAASRFHRPPSGLGLSEAARVHIKSLRMLTDAMNVFACAPHPDLLSERSPNEAYCLAEPGRQYAIYFPTGGAVRLDVSAAPGTLPVRWLDISRSAWQAPQTVSGGGTLELKTPGPGPWAVLVSP